MKYVGAMAVLAALLGVAVALLGLGLGLIDPKTGGAALVAAVVVGWHGAKLTE